MIRMFYHSCISILLLVNSLFAQEVFDTKPKKQSLHVELLGRSIIFASLNYEYSFSNNLSLGAGVGFGAFQSGDISRNVNGNRQEGRYFDANTSQTLFANYFIGKTKNRFLLTGGLTNLLMTSRNKYPKEVENSLENSVHWNAGFGYQVNKPKVFYRITAYAVDLPESDFLPTVAPWLGFAVGFRF